MLSMTFLGVNQRRTLRSRYYPQRNDCTTPYGHMSLREEFCMTQRIIKILVTHVLVLLDQILQLPSLVFA